MRRWKLLLTLALLATITLIGDRGLVNLLKLKGRASSLRHEISALSDENRRLAEEIERLKEPEYLERLIREERGYIKEGEILLEIPGQNSLTE